jgi:hypothetical protein
VDSVEYIVCTAPFARIHTLRTASRKRRRSPSPPPGDAQPEYRFTLAKAAGRPKKLCSNRDEIIANHRRGVEAKKKKAPVTGLMVFLKKRKVEDID